MRFLLIARRLNNTQSTPKCNLNLALALARLGHEVFLLTSYFDSNLRITLAMKQKIKLFTLDKQVSSKYKAPYIYSYHAKRLKEKHEIDIVIGNGYTFFDDITWVHFIRSAWISKLKTLKYSIPLKLNIEASLERQIYRTSKTLWAPSRKTMNDLVKFHNIPVNKIHVVHHGVDTNYYKPMTESERKELRAKLGFQDKIVLLFVGGSDYVRKGFYVLLRELGLLQHRKDITVLTTGFITSTYLNSYLQKLGLDDMMKVLGVVSADKLKLYYQLSDFFILPSLYDPFSLATLEAMACGAVPIVSTYAGSSEIIRTGLNGFVIDPLIEGSLSNLIKNTILSLSQNAIWKLRNNVIATAKALSWINVAKRLLKWLTIS